MKNRFKYLLIVLVALSACTKKPGGKVQAKIEAAADACNGAPGCTITVANLTDFDWDFMFAFNTPQPRDIIERLIGTDFPGYDEKMHAMIFIKDGKIVYYENNVDGLIKGTPGQVIFNYMVGLKYKAYRPEESKFTVKVEHVKYKTFYSLSQVPRQ